MKKFWMLYVEYSIRGPEKLHLTLAEANLEAERLAEKTGQRVFVLEAFSAVKKKDFDWIRLEG